MISEIIEENLISVALALIIIGLSGFALLYHIHSSNREKKTAPREIKRLEKSFTALGLTLPISLSVIFISMTSSIFNIDSTVPLFICYTLLTISILFIGYALVPFLPVKIKIDLGGFKEFL